MNLGQPDSKLNDCNGSSTMYQRTSNFLLPVVSMFIGMHALWCISMRKTTLQLQTRLAFFSIQTSDLYDNVALLRLHLETGSGSSFQQKSFLNHWEKIIGILCFMERQYDTTKIL